MLFQPDGRHFLTWGGKDDIVRLWDTETDSVLQSWKRRFVMSAAISADGKLVVTGDEEKPAVSIWDGASSSCLHSAWSALPGAVAIRPDSRIVAGGDGANVHLWSTATGRLLMTFAGNEARAYTVAFSPDSHRVASVSLGLNLWDTRKGILRHQMGAAGLIDFSPGGKALACGSPPIVGAGAMHSQVDLYDIEKGQKTGTIPNLPGVLKAVQYHPTENLLLLVWTEGNKNSVMQIWDLGKGKPTRSFVLPSTVFWAAFSPDGKHIGVIVNGSANYEIRLLDAASGKALHTMAGAPLLVFSAMDQQSARFSPDGKMICASVGPKSSFVDHDRDSKVQIWDTATGRPLTTLATGKPLDFTPEGAMLATVDQSTDVAFWDVNTGRRVKTMRGSDQPVVTGAISRDGKRMITGSDNVALVLWDLTTDSEIIRIIGRDWQELPGNYLKNIEAWKQGDSDYLLITPDNYYMATPGAFRNVAFRIGNRAYPFEQFDLKYNRPDLVLERLDCPDKALVEAYRAAVRLSLRRAFSRVSLKTRRLRFRVCENL